MAAVAPKQPGLFDNPSGMYHLDEFTDTVRMLERELPGRAVDELAQAVFTELGLKRTRRAADLVAEAIRRARARGPGAEIAGSRSQASTAEVREWAVAAGFDVAGEGRLPAHAISAYNQLHPEHPY